MPSAYHLWYCGSDIVILISRQIAWLLGLVCTYWLHSVHDTQPCLQKFCEGKDKAASQCVIITYARTVHISIAECVSMCTFMIPGRKKHFLHRQTWLRLSVASGQWPVGESGGCSKKKKWLFWNMCSGPEKIKAAVQSIIGNRHVSFNNCNIGILATVMVPLKIQSILYAQLKQGAC